MPPALSTIRRPRGDPFSELNEAQRHAVEHGLSGGGDPAEAGPLLIVAGAGTGKTLTLAARVARLVLAGADPSRMLLLTFSRRAAAEMARRVGQAAAPRARPDADAGAAAARLVRNLPQHRRPPAARACGRGSASTPSFTVDDRADSEDLLHLVRQRLGLGRRPPALSAEERPAWRSIRASSTRARSLADVLASAFPWCAGWHDELKRLFAAYVAEKQAQRVLDFDDLLVWWAEALADAAVAGAMARALRSRAGRRIPGHQSPAGRDPARPQARRPRPHGRRRRCAVDLLVSRRRRPQHPRLPAPLRAAGDRSSRWSATTARPRRCSTAANAVIALAAEATPQAPLERTAFVRAPRPRLRRRRGRPGRPGSPTASWPCANRACAWSIRRCSFGRRSTAMRSSSSWRGATSRSSSTAASSSSTPPM